MEVPPALSTGHGETWQGDRKLRSGSEQGQGGCSQCVDSLNRRAEKLPQPNAVAREKFK
jgi:hypothetical protein